MDERASGAEPSEFENSLARWAARVAAVLLVASMAAMSSMVAWLDADEIAAASAARDQAGVPAPVNVQARPGQVMAGDRGPAADFQTTADASAKTGQAVASLSPHRPLTDAAGVSARPRAEAAAPAGDRPGAATAGLWSPPADRVSIPIPAPAEGVGAESLGELSDEEWLARVMQRVGKQANRTAAAAFRALDGFLFENRPPSKGVALLPPPGEPAAAPLTVSRIPMSRSPAPDQATAARAATAPPAATERARASSPTRSAASVAPADRVPATAALRPSQAGEPLSLKAPGVAASLRAAAVPQGEDRRTSQGPPSASDGNRQPAQDGGNETRGPRSRHVDGPVQIAMADRREQEYSGDWALLDAPPSV